MGKVIVFGSFVVDLMARSRRLPTPGETVRGSLFKMGPGGKGFNQGVAAHKAGADVTMVTKLGEDALADVALNTMARLKMSQDYVFRTSSEQTGTALILVDEETSQNQIIVNPCACNTISADEVKSIENVVKESEYCLLQLEVNQDANEEVVKLCKKWGCKVIVNTAPYAPMSDDFLAQLYMVTPNEKEAEEATGVTVIDFASAKNAAKFFQDKGVEVVIITLGSRGAFVSAGGREEIIPSFKVDAVDTTGAGDAFNGGLLAALAEGKDVFEAAQFANALAALSVQKIGTTPAMPTRKEIDDFFKARQAENA